MTNGTDKKLNEEIAKTQTYIAELQAAIKWQRVYLAKLMFKVVGILFQRKPTTTISNTEGSASAGPFLRFVSIHHHRHYNLQVRLQQKNTGQQSRQLSLAAWVLSICAYA